MVWVSVSIAEAHGALKNHAEHRSASECCCTLLLYSERLITKVPGKQSREIMASAVDGQKRRSNTWPDRAPSAQKTTNEVRQGSWSNVVPPVGFFARGTATSRWSQDLPVDEWKGFESWTLR